MQLSKFELEKLINDHQLQIRSISSDDDDPDSENPIKSLCTHTINADYDSSDAFLTKSKFLDAILEDWFSKRVVSLMIAGQLPEDGHMEKIFPHKPSTYS